MTFTFPHIGNVGANTEDEEAAQSFARGCILREPVTAPSNWRSDYPFTDWLKRQGLIGLAGVDTRALTHQIREAEAPTATLVHRTAGPLDIEAALAAARVEAAVRVQASVRGRQVRARKIGAAAALEETSAQVEASGEVAVILDQARIDAAIKVQAMQRGRLARSQTLRSSW